MSFLDKHFPSKYLKAADVVRPLTLTIESIGEDVMRDGGSKPVAFFHGDVQGLVINKTNGAILSEAFGGDETAWTGKTIRLVSEKVDFGGKRVDAIRVRIPDPALDADVPF